MHQLAILGNQRHKHKAQFQSTPKNLCESSFHFHQVALLTPLLADRAILHLDAPVLRVCGVSPGVTLLSGPMVEAEFALAHGLTPLHRSSTPDDIAHAVRFLLESPAITGHTLLVDGGQHLLGQPRDVLFLAQQQLATAAPKA